MVELLKAMVWAGGGFAISTLFSLVTTKVLAVTAGPVGVGMYSLLRATTQWFIVLGTMNGQVSLVRGVASTTGDERASTLAVAVRLFAAGTALVALSCIVLAPAIATLVFNSDDGQMIWAVRCISLSVALGAMSAFLLAVLNGVREVRTLARCQITGAACAALIAYPIGILHHPVGYVFLGASSLCGSAVAALIALRHSGLLRQMLHRAALEPAKPVLARYLGTSLVTAVTGIFGAGLVLLLRAIYTSRGGFELAGLFDSAWTLSTMGLAFLTSVFGTYYFPTLSAARSEGEIRRSISNMFRVATFVSILLLSFTIAFKELIIQLVYSREFEQSTKLLRWLLIADFMKAMAFVLGMPMLSFSRNRMFLACELGWQAIVISIVLLGPVSGLEAVGMAVVCANALYLLVLWRFARGEYGWRPAPRESLSFAWGCIVIVALSAVTWHGGYNILVSAAIWLAVAIISLFLLTTGGERARLRAKVASSMRSKASR